MREQISRVHRSIHRFRYGNAELIAAREAARYKLACLLKAQNRTLRRRPDRQSPRIGQPIHSTCENGSAPFPPASASPRPWGPPPPRTNLALRERSTLALDTGALDRAQDTSAERAGIRQLMRENRMRRSRSLSSATTRSFVGSRTTAAGALLRRRLHTRDAVMCRGDHLRSTAVRGPARHDRVLLQFIVSHICAGSVLTRQPNIQ